MKNEVVLAVNEKNIPAQKLYAEKLASRHKGLRRMGPIGQHHCNAFTYHKIMRRKNLLLHSKVLVSFLLEQYML